MDFFFHIGKKWKELTCENMKNKCIFLWFDISDPQLIRFQLVFLFLFGFLLQ